ncbi:hypothetical protein [Brevundimonas nasdae]|uniref:Oligosaccharide repeat unit polymerase n=1 Tax=Brevundimonas nasdae TaxID=172043 RepID=A0ABX8TGQ3_9CAUL|nr:hypothetical protein [Brevundimonas nasdae]QYC09813.1 hypothetical protein KWG56_14735 [Brevundimonas nasdae]QYC12602.1 hypothetical protein KWG63_10055 [Brevundimonas nasdae]
MTTLNIIACAFLISVLHAVLPRPGNQSGKVSRISEEAPLLSLALFCYLLVSVVSFVQTGIANGGHWFHSVHEGLENSPLILITKHISSTLRTAIFGLLYYRWRGKKISLAIALSVGAGVVVFDSFTTFNRISAAYYGTMVIMMMAKSRFTQISFITASLLVVPQASNVWTTFRGLFSVRGYSIDSFQQALFDAVRYNGQYEMAFADKLNGIFESINLTVINHIINQAGDGIPAMWGSTFLLRPATFYIPKMIWEGRPESYGFVLGRGINRLEQLALNSTLLGEAFGNFLYLWPFALSGVLALYTLAYNKISNFHPSVGFAAAFMAFAMWRLDSSFGTIGLAFLLLSLIGISTIYQRRAPYR